MPKRKELVPDVKIVSLGHKGVSIGKTTDGLVIFTQGAVPGDVCDIRVLRKKKGVWNGVVERISQESPDRIEAPCQHFGECGGCKWQHFTYEGQLREKEQAVHDAIKRIAGVEDAQIEPIQGSESIFHYRNKLEYSFSTHRWLTKDEIASDRVIETNGAIGLHPPGNYMKVVELEECLLQPALSNQIRNFVGDYAREHGYDFFDPGSHRGYLRNMIVRNTLENHWMVILSFYYEDVERREALLDAIAVRFSEITSLHYVINGKKNDSLFDQEIICYQGEPVLVERLEQLKFRIRPKSFFQTNTAQTLVLYNYVKSLAGLSSDEVVYDLYCGLGSITLFLAATCQHIVGIEEVEDAIRDAKDNAELNEITNASFVAGDVRKILTEEFVSAHGRPDVVITDPPRAGMHEDVVLKLLELSPARIVYVSCNPSTQARDLKLLLQHYTLEKTQPVDMFPHTAHVENIVSLHRK